MQDNFEVNKINAQVQPTSQCIIAQKIYGQCRQQDCLQPKANSNSANPSLIIDSSMLAGKQTINTATPNILVGNTIKPGSVIALGTGVSSVQLVPGTFAVGNIKVVSVTPAAFGQAGYWDIIVKYQFTYEINLLDAAGTPIQVNYASNSGTPVTNIPAYTTYTKEVSLFGGAGNAQNIYMASTLYNPEFTYTVSNAPYVMVQAIANPLDVKLNKYTGVAGAQSQVDITIGLFTIIKAYRLVDMSVESNGKCDIPVGESVVPGDPCSSFNNLPFPFDDFNPPSTAPIPTPPTPQIPTPSTTPVKFN